jgi:hypothetical protein
MSRDQILSDVQVRRDQTIVSLTFQTLCRRKANSPCMRTLHSRILWSTRWIQTRENFHSQTTTTFCHIRWLKTTIRMYSDRWKQARKLWKSRANNSSSSSTTRPNRPASTPTAPLPTAPTPTAATCSTETRRAPSSLKTSAGFGQQQPSERLSHKQCKLNRRSINRPTRLRRSERQQTRAATDARAVQSCPSDGRVGRRSS